MQPAGGFLQVSASTSIKPNMLLWFIRAAVSSKVELGCIYEVCIHTVLLNGARSGYRVQ